MGPMALARLQRSPIAQVLTELADNDTMTGADNTTTDIDALLDELSRVLWRQRELIELLDYRLEVQRLVLMGGRPDHLQRALGDVETAMDEIRRLERNRDLVVRECAGRIGLAPDATLSMLKDSVAEPWSSRLAEHQNALLALVAATERNAAANREIAAQGAAETRGVIDEITGTPSLSGYGPNGTRNSGGGLSRPALVDREV